MISGGSIIVGILIQFLENHNLRLLQIKIEKYRRMNKHSRNFNSY